MWSVTADAKSSNLNLPPYNNEEPDSTSTGKKDEDGDGVKDSKDKCPKTPTGVTVDKDGCPVDEDRDGTADYLDKCPKMTGPASMGGCPDRDKDGMSDLDDVCPDVPGLARFRGCPDSDGDGVEDSKDKCPNSKGLDMFKGCPDTDGDGVEDTQDKCPSSEKGIKVDASGCTADSDRDGIIDAEDKCLDTRSGVKVDNRGCPLDTDGDGIIDTDDKCPTTKGEGTANGCPVIKAEVKKRLQFAARGINFETGKSIIVPASYAMLNEIVSILKEYPDYNLKMGGHTDNVGDDNANYSLSQARVDAVKTYLVSKGVDISRIDATGFGETKPIATNATAVGKMQNRRVELELLIK
ncbi:MAG: OmpA family protein [Bacteroidota bacterium]|nr:OmpA family protein [Bacteroidota bacterium]